MKNRVKVWFVWSQSKWLWLVAGNRYLQCDGLGKVFVLDKVGELAVRAWGGGNCIECLKRGWNEKRLGKKILEGGILDKRMGAL